MKCYIILLIKDISISCEEELTNSLGNKRANIISSSLKENRSCPL